MVAQKPFTDVIYKLIIRPGEGSGRKHSKATQAARLCVVNNLA